MLDELRPDYAWLPAGIPLSAALDRAGWHRLYSGPISIVFSRDDRQTVADPVLRGRRAFPGHDAASVRVSTFRRRSPAQAIELKWQIWLPWLALALILLTATRTDPDLWGHVRFGLDWLRTRALPAIDPSFTQDRPWVNHEWLSEALMGGAFRSGGPPAWSSSRRPPSRARCRWSGGACATPARSFASRSRRSPSSGRCRSARRCGRRSGRSSGWRCWCRCSTSGGRPRRAIAAAAALFAVWANLHGGWITGGAALLLHVAIRAMRAPRQAAAWVGLGAASLAATLLNPYGLGLWRFLAATVRASRPDIPEWAPFGLHEPLVMWVSVIAPLALLGLLVRRRDTARHPKRAG